MPSYVLFSLAAAVTVAVSLLVNKIVLKNARYDTWSYTFWFHFMHGMWGAVLFFLMPISRVQAAEAWGFAAVGALLWVMANTILFWILHRLDASVTGSLFPLKLLFVPFIAYVFIGEVFTPAVYVWFVPLIFGGFLVTMDERMHIRSFFKKEIGFMFLALLLFTLSDIFGKMGIDRIGAFPYVVIFLGFTCLSALLFVPFLTKKSTAPWGATVRLFGLLSFITVAINIFFVLALRSNVTLTNALSMLNAPFLLLITFIMSRFKPELLEKHPARVYAIRALGSLVMYASAVAIVLQ